MFPLWARCLPWDVITAQSLLYSLDELLVGAMVCVESNGSSYAMRFEPHFKYIKTPERFAKQLGISLETEKAAQMTSWGLLQVMGGTARDLGFQQHLSKLCDPELGLGLGVRYLAMQMQRHNDEIPKAVAAYNAGTPRVTPSGEYENQIYVNKVIKHYNELKGKLL